MQLKFLTREEFLDLSQNDSAELMRMIRKPTAFIVRQFYAREKILQLREKIFKLGITTDASWHPLHDNCPDYHRLHDNYAQAYVKAKMHAFYFHGWYKHNQELFDTFKEVFQIKNSLGGAKPNEFINNIPSDGYIARVNFQNYPAGGGYQSEHTDPVGKQAQIQTLIQASEYGQDFSKGGLFCRENLESEKLYLDQYSSPGDMFVMSPGIQHGVDPIDPEATYDWQKSNGRWIIIPLVVSSDYAVPGSSKPVTIAAPALSAVTSGFESPSY